MATDRLSPFWFIAIDLPRWWALKRFTRSKDDNAFCATVFLVMRHAGLHIRCVIILLLVSRICDKPKNISLENSADIKIFRLFNSRNFIVPVKRSPQGGWWEFIVWNWCCFLIPPSRVYFLKSADSHSHPNVIITNNSFHLLDCCWLFRMKRVMYLM